VKERHRREKESRRNRERCTEREGEWERERERERSKNKRVRDRSQTFQSLLTLCFVTIQSVKVKKCFEAPSHISGWFMLEYEIVFEDLFTLIVNLECPNGDLFFLKPIVSMAMFHIPLQPL